MRAPSTPATGDLTDASATPWLGSHRLSIANRARGAAYPAILFPNLQATVDATAADFPHLRRNASVPPAAPPELAEELASLLPPLPDIHDVSALSGVAVQTLRNKRSAGKLPPAIRVGRRVVWPRDAIVRWVLAGAESDAVAAKTANSGTTKVSA